MGTFFIMYLIIGREDGRWIIRAFDRNEKPLGTQITVNTPSEAWKIWMLLNGYSVEEPGVPDDTQPSIEFQSGRAS